MRFPIRSIRWQMVILFIVIAFSVGIPLRVSNYRFMRDRLMNDLDNRLARRLNVLEELTQRSAPPEMTRAVMEDLLIAPAGRGILAPYPVSLVIPKDDATAESEFAGIWQEGAWVQGWGLGEEIGDPALLPTERFRVHSAAGPHGELIVAGSRVDILLKELHQLTAIYFGTMTVAAFILVPIAMVIANIAMRPVRDISRIAQRIARGETRLRLDTGTMVTELRDMGGALNEMIDRLEGQAMAQAAFTADISHELGNPINSILLQVQMARDGSASPEELRSTLRSCGDLAERMNRLRKGLLDLARAETTAPTVFPPIDLEPVLEEALDSVRDMARAKRVRLDCQPLGQEACANPDLLHQVLVNLLTNAIRHSPPGGTVRLESCTEQDGEAVLTVLDEGPGVAPELLPHLFGRFRSGGTKSQRKVDGHGRETEGNGLGLAICQSILVAHRGSISYRQENGVGAIFEIRMPGQKSNSEG
jgi:signal transduction histidine kinase